MLEMKENSVPRTTTDVVFENLHNDIVSLALLPGAKMSEAEVAARMGVSRQPVRDAFNRLAHMDLLSIRPQRATRVRGFSAEKIANARFVRLSIELEVIRRAHSVWDDAKAAVLDRQLDIQRAAIDAGDIGEFHALDYDFHKAIFDMGGHPLAFDMVVQCKQPVDRLCVLSLGDKGELSHVFADHERIANALARGSVEQLEDVTRQHLSRLDATIRAIREKHAEYFE